MGVNWAEAVRANASANSAINIVRTIPLERSTPSAQRSTLNCQMNTTPEGNRIGIIDAVGHDAKTDEAVLVMNEPGEWDGSDARLHELQERFNAYASFLLDGEMAEAHPELAGKRGRIEVRCAQMPDARAIELLGMIHDQLAFQDIKMEVVVAERGDCGPGCACSKN
jgi:hypothetical protein